MAQAVEHLTFSSELDQMNVSGRRQVLDEEIRRLAVLCQMPASYIGLDYQTEPSFFSALAPFGKLHELVLIKPPGFAGLAGLGIRSVRPCYLDGQVTEVGYLHHLRFHPEIRGGSYLLRGYKAFHQIFAAQPLKVTFTSILADNFYARELLEASRAGGIMPVYKQVSRFMTALIPLKGPGQRWPERFRTVSVNSGLSVRRLTRSDIADVCRLFALAGQKNDGAPVLTRECFNGGYSSFPGLLIEDMVGVFDRTGLVAATGIWNQQKYRQIVVTHLCQPLNILQTIWEKAGSFVGQCPVPAIGGCVNYVLLDPWAVMPGREGELMPILVKSGVREARRRGVMFAAMGMAEKFPAIEALNTVFFLPYWSIIYQVFWPESGEHEFGNRPLHISNLGGL